MTVTQIHSETLLEFVERVGVVSAENVEFRFAWGNRQARQELKRLVKSGHLIEEGRFPRCGGGALLEWRLAVRP